MSPTLSEYVVTLRHDSGTIRIRTLATSFDNAAEVVAAAELAPLRAVVAVRRA